MSSAQQFCVRWNSYHTNLQTIFPKLLSTENFADVTLACENRQLKCHKVVLSACSAYFERLLVQNPCKHPIIFMKDMRFREMQSLVDFMYKGEVNVTQDDLPSLLKSAEALQIRGLCGSDANTLNPTGGDQKDYVKPKNGEAFSTEKVTHAQHQHSNAPSKKRKSYEDDAVGERNSSGQHHQSAADAVKEETVEEDGLYYGEMEDGENYDDQDDDSGKPGSSLVQPSASKSLIRVKPESSLKTTQAEYLNKLSKMNPFEIQKEFAKYGFTTNTNELKVNRSSRVNDCNDIYKSWLERNDELEVSLLNQRQNDRVSQNGGNLPLAGNTNLTAVKKGSRRGRPPLFKDKFMDIGDSVFKADLDQFLEGKEISSSGLSRKDLEKVMMGKFNPNRRYSNEAMWAALMDVKRGGSIYRAAQTHKVPRKSLRNWMKRCHIKSSFPMPQQLKQFVENNKKQKEIYNKYHNYTPSDFEPKINEPQTTEASKPLESVYYDDYEFGKHFLSVASSNTSEDENSVATPVPAAGEITQDIGDLGKCDGLVLDMSLKE